MDVFVARQPIFDRHRNIYGYELLYRKSRNNYYEGTDDSISTAETIEDSFLIFGFDDLTDGTKGFVKFADELLLQRVPMLLPHQKVVVEIMKRVYVTDEIIRLCRELKEKGYTIALDEYDTSNENGNCVALLEFADIVKIEYTLVPRNAQIAMLEKYGDRITFLAEKVETEQDFQSAKQMGYKLFQGYFFSKPILKEAKDIVTENANQILVLRELEKLNPDFEVAEKIIQEDLGFSYKILRLANSVYYAPINPIKSIRQVLMRLGTQRIVGWIHLLLLRGLTNAENTELVKTCMIRGKMLALLATETQKAEMESNYFITGIFSSLDSLLNGSMQDIVKELPLDEDVKNALLGENNEIRGYLNSILALEQNRFEDVKDFVSEHEISQEKYMLMYLHAIRWQRILPK